MRKILFIVGLMLLFVPEILRVYLIMPFPGSQKSDSIRLAYWLDRHIAWIRILGILFIVYPLWYVFAHSKMWKKVAVVISLVVYGIVFYYFNFRFEADKMFYQPRVLSFHTDAPAGQKDADKLVIGVVLNGEAKAYPIQLIGYHHQVRDTIGGSPVMITYCTVCRTGRVYSPVVDGKPETFRLVGMDHFNAMFEDARTKSWWQQATGEAIAGPLKGKKLKEIPSQQMTLSTWLFWHPRSATMQRDSSFNKQYDELAEYDNGTVKSSLEKRDSLSWQFKSWVVGIEQNGAAKAFDWNDLVKQRMIQDSVGGIPLVLSLEKDDRSFHAWSRTVGDKQLLFDMEQGGEFFTDRNTGSVWNMNGECVNGALKGNRLEPVQAYQEFWHSWKTFHPGVLRKS